MPLLLLLALAAVAGDTTSAPAQATAHTAPYWVTHLPGGEIHQYFRGDATDENYEKAKLMARADAYRKAVLWASEEGRSDTLTESLEISTAGSSDLSSETTLTFDPATFKKIEWVADYSTRQLINEYSSSGKTAYHYYCLIRLKKPERNIFIQVVQGITGRADAVFHSAILPGWGQWRQGRGGSSAFYMLSGMALGATVGGFYIAETAAKDDPKKTWNKATFKKFRRGATYAFAGLYAANLVDALIFGREYHEYYTGASLTPGPDGRGLGVQYQFALR